MNEYRNTRSSVLKFCKDFITEVTAWGFNLELMDFDTAGEPQMWPEKDVIGIGEFTLTLDDGTISVQMAVGLSTFQDKNNFRLIDLLNLLLNKLIPGKQIPLINASNGQLISFLVVQNGTQVSPPLPTKSRTLQPIMVSLLSGQTLRG